jgi:hypothetical protein
MADKNKTQRTKGKVTTETYNALKIYSAPAKIGHWGKKVPIEHL